MKYVLVLLLISVFTACNNGHKNESSKTSSSMNEATINLSNETGIPIHIINLLAAASGAKVEHLCRQETGLVDLNDSTYVHKKSPLVKSVMLPGIWTLKKVDTGYYDLVREIQSKIKGKGYRIFICDGKDAKEPNRLAIVQSEDEFTPLVYMQTNGINAGLDNSQLITRLKILSQRLDLILLGADFDWCEFQINKDPESWELLAEEIYKFCPDIVDQGTQTVSALAKELRQTRRLYLWFD